MAESRPGPQGNLQQAGAFPLSFATEGLGRGLQDGRNLRFLTSRPSQLDMCPSTCAVVLAVSMTLLSEAPAEPAPTLEVLRYSSLEDQVLM